jgi:nucleoside 2-deoxyribosyltransferase
MNRNRRIDAIRRDLHTLYLCGPITGVPVFAATAWRRKVIAALGREARIIDPTRDVAETVRRCESVTTQKLTLDRFLHGKRTVARDRFDIRRSDLVLACFLGAKAVSIGAVGEIFWADAMGKPVIVVREDDNVHNHDMLNELAGWIFGDLDAAIEQVRRVIRTHDISIERS